MLNWRCRRFRAQLEPLAPDAVGTRGARHRAGCPECDAYARTLERAAAVRLPLPTGLANVLLGLPQSADLPALAGPVPELPLPPTLHLRLVAIGSRPALRRKPPVWLVEPRYTVAASLLLTLMFSWLVGNPTRLGFQAIDAALAASRRAGRPLAEVRATAGDKGRAQLQDFGRRIEAVEGRVSTGAQDLGGRMKRWTVEVKGWIEQENLTNRGGSVPPGRSRRTP